MGDDAPQIPVFPTLPDVTWPVGEGFWAAAAREQLAFPSCTSCGLFTWYPMTHCPNCLTKTLDWKDVAPDGSIASYTVIRRAFLAGTEQNLPHYVLRVRIDSAPGVHLISTLADRRQAAGVVIGSRVRMVFPEIAPGLRMPLAEIVPLAGD